jgi:hypothetical protein
MPILTSNLSSRNLGKTVEKFLIASGGTASISRIDTLGKRERSTIGSSSIGPTRVLLSLFEEEGMSSLSRLGHCFPVSRRCCTDFKSSWSVNRADTNCKREEGGVKRLRDPLTLHSRGKTGQTHLKRINLVFN